jgi:1,4-dihydroxy-2-naphthoyl-CoA hydrolase
MIVADEILQKLGMHRDEFIQLMNEKRKNTAMQTLDIEYTELASDRVVMTMPVGPKTHQPAGILHGGASVLLAETAASIASFINIDSKKYAAVGQRSTPIILKAKEAAL